MLIGREKEQGVLAEAFQADESMFVAVYGRRRVGKTYLIRESMGSRFTFHGSGFSQLAEVYCEYHRVGRCGVYW